MRKRVWMSICVLILLCAVWYGYTVTTSKNQKSFQGNVAQLSFVPKPSETVPFWVNNGNGMVLSVALKEWSPLTDSHAGYYVIVPTTTYPSNIVSMYDYPDGHSEPTGFNPTWGAGPNAQTNAINEYLRQRHLATLNLGDDSVLTPRGNTQNIDFEVVVGNVSEVKLQPSDLRLAVLELQELGDDTFKVLGGEIFSSDGNIQMLTNTQH